jgi:diphosphomevalonate decarboxylase
MQESKTNIFDESLTQERINKLLDKYEYKNEYQNISAVAKGPINIAIIKYWGKENEEKIIPLNNSISITLDMDECHTYTEARLILPVNNDESQSDLFKTNLNILYLNNQEEKLSKRLENLVEYFRKKCDNKLYASSPLLIESINRLPTAAGCASSASSMSCIVKVLSKIFLNDSLNVHELSALARLGSGSACRSIQGGFVEWEKFDEEYKDSVAKQVVDEKHWPEMRVLLLIVSDKRKEWSSTDGMKTSKETSELLNYRLNTILPNRIPEMKEAIFSKNFEKVCELTMKDSNNFHAICRDTYPTINYLNDTSNLIIKSVERINSHFGRTVCGYTFDAGPNAFILVEDKNIETVTNCFNNIFSLGESKTIENKSLNDIVEKLSSSAKDINAKIVRLVEFKVGNGIQSE